MNPQSLPDPAWIEDIYLRWKVDPQSVDPEWRAFFQGFELGRQESASPSEGGVHKQASVQAMIERYREVGHLMAWTNPIGTPPPPMEQLQPAAFDLVDIDQDKPFRPEGFQLTEATLPQITELLQQTYCQHIGVEFMHIPDATERQWLVQRMEASRNRTAFSGDSQKQILHKLQEAVLFEQTLHTTFLGQKRFSLEGGEALIPMLDQMVRRAASLGVKDLVLGMAHRGRLNVLANIFGKPLQNIFSEFSDNLALRFVGEGDVKYHKGFSCDRTFDGGATIHMSLASNPSHLEVVSPIVVGKARSRQDGQDDTTGGSVLPIVLHGDAAFAGQGVVMETLNLSQLDGYSAGGTIHIVLNNQIGFTTSPRDGRSTPYATDVAKMLNVPIFHIHGDKPEAAAHAALLALEYRQTFGKDAVLDLICYRRYGHNEGDEPAFTQPVMYSKIRQHPTVDRIYADELVQQGHPSRLHQENTDEIKGGLEHAMEQPPIPDVDAGFLDKWNGMQLEWSDDPVETGVEKETLHRLAEKLTALPEGFAPHPKIAKLVDKRRQTILSDGSLDWGTAESLAYATLVTEGVPVRLSGQDSRRGTFNQRHATLYDKESGASYLPLNHLTEDQATFQVWDSPLSEMGVLGFEYGYSVETPNGLTLWEAQFGDFVNGAQVVIDQFIVASETKWQRMSGLTLLLPHGYEGQGAEHSSARPERFLQLCAHNNIQVVNPTTPAQLFHLLRRQVKRDFRRPLVVLTPKSLLRHPVCVSPLEDLAQGHFQEVLPESRVPVEGVKKVLICSGKIYYELHAYREEHQREDVAIVRLEQLYPLPARQLVAAIKDYPEETHFVYVQEETDNGGAWNYLRSKLTRLFGREPDYINRPPSPAPAGGSHRMHNLEQQEIIESAFAVEP